MSLLSRIPPSAGCRAALAAACMALAPALLAAPVSVSVPFFNLEYRGANSMGWATGAQVRFGANSVTPLATNSNPIDWDAGTVAWARRDGPGITSCSSPGADCVRLLSDPGPLIPNFVDRYLADSPAYRGAWTLFFQNGSDVATRSVYLDPAAQQAPKVANITLSGSSETPTFTWAPPAGATVNGYRVNIFDKSLISATNNGQVVSQNLQPDQTSFIVDPSKFTLPGYAFDPNGRYVIEISLIQTKDGTSGNLGNANLQAIARMYADFTPTAGGHVINLPVVLDDGSFQFDMTVVPGVTYYIDPAVAIGYDYAIGAGDPNFLSVDLPDDIGNGLYDIWGWDAADMLVLLAQDWSGRDVYHFGAGGVGRFRVTGIEIGAGLDPANTTAFVTGLTFAGAGSFTGTQTPITVNVNDVPEPGTLALLFMGAMGIGLVRPSSRRRSR